MHAPALREPPHPAAPVLPHSIDAEQAVLGGIMHGQGEALNEIRDAITEADFFRADHQLIFRSLCACADKRLPLDAVTMTDWCNDHGTLHLLPDAGYLTGLQLAGAPVAAIRPYADVVRRKADLRRLIDVCQSTINAAMQPGDANADCAEDLLATAAAHLADLARDRAHAGGLTMAKAGLPAMWDDLQKRYLGSSGNGLVPPWKSVEAKIPELEAGELMVVAARPGVGKTANAMQWATHAAQAGRNTAVFSLEMGTTQLLTRMLAHLTGIPQTRMRQKGGLQDEDWAKLNEATRTIKELPIAIDDSGGLTIEQIRARALRMHAKVEGGLGLVVVDYLQLVRPSERKSSNSRNDEIAHISRELKQLARELTCPVIALAQLNRQIENRTDKTPSLSDLRDSGAIEQDADIIAFLYREDYYRLRQDDSADDPGGCPNLCEFIIAKNRNGETGTAMLRHRLACSTFDDGTGLVRFRPPPERRAARYQQRATWGLPDVRARRAA